MMKARGLALIVVVGILGVLAVLAVAFVAMAQLERRASQQRVHAAKAYLLARSGIEDALARMALGQDPAYGGEDWDADGTLSTFEAAQEVHHRTGAGTPADVAACPVRHALRPSFFATNPLDAKRNPRALPMDGRQRGYSGRLSGDAATDGSTYALKIQSSNAGIHINGGALDDKDRDPDGPGAAPEAAPLMPNGIPDHRDPSMEGPNGFLVRLLNNLDAIVSTGASARLGEEIVGARPIGGYASLDALKSVLGQARFDRFKPFLTLHARVDTKVVKPQPMDGRPQRWEDIDDAHRIGTEAKEISGVHHDPTPFTVSGVSGYYLVGTTDVATGIPTSFPRLTLHPGITGNGKESSLPASSLPWTPLTGSLGADGPWIQTITATNTWEGSKTYPVLWERDFVYAWSQLRPAPIAMEPRAPLSLNTASPEALASAILGLKGTTLEVWEGSAGWDGGFGFTTSFGADPGYPYPSPATDETPWHRTRLDYGMTYGRSAFALPGRPWYGPATYDPHDTSASTSRHAVNISGVGVTTNGGGGTPVIQAAPLGRLKETPAITPAQALAIARQVHQVMVQEGPARSWAQVNAFLDALPRWEDVNEDGLLDGAPYPVVGSLGAPYTRRIYLREDMNPRGYGAGDFLMQRETFTLLPGTSWKAGNIAWLDPHLPKAGLGSFDLVPGLTFVQKDVLKAMANPNTDLNDFNPDGNLWKEVDKTDLAGIQADPASYAHTTELSLDDSAGFYSLRALGRVTAGNGRLLALRQAGALVRLGEIHRDTTQSDFMQGTREGQTVHAIFQALPAPYAWAGDQPLVSYPEPQTLGDLRGAQAGYDGQVSLGFVGSQPMMDETFRGDLFDALDAGGTKAVPDLRGPFQNPLLLPAGARTGNVFPDGVYSEKDRSLKFRMKDALDYSTPPRDYDPNDGGHHPLNENDVFYIACWAKVAWYPEASPRAHALVSLSPSGSGRYGKGFGDSVGGYAPVVEIPALPEGLYFVPARNSLWQDRMELYRHSASATQGVTWPCRSLLWGSVHSLWASDDLNRRGILELPPGTHPVGRLEAHRWAHLAMRGMYVHEPAHTKLILGRNPASLDGGGWALDFSLDWKLPYPLSPTHLDGTDNHLRFGEIAGEHNMNYAADATFANLRAGKYFDYERFIDERSHDHDAAFTGTSSPAVLGRYGKEPWAAYVSSKLPSGIHPVRITWTEIPCDLWFDKNGDGWLGDPLVGAEASDGGLTAFALGTNVNYSVGASLVIGGTSGSVNAGANVGLSYSPLNDQFGSGGTPGRNGLRDVRIALEVWDDTGRLARFDDPAADNRIPRPRGRLYYKAVFVNEWDPATRANFPLDVTPFLDDVTITYTGAGGPRVLNWEASGEG